MAMRGCERFEGRRAPSGRNPRNRLIRHLLRLDAAGLAAHVWAVQDVRELPEAVRTEVVAVIGVEAAERGVDRSGKPNALGRELDELAGVLLTRPP